MVESIVATERVPDKSKLTWKKKDLEFDYKIRKKKVLVPFLITGKERFLHPPSMLVKSELYKICII